MQRFKNILCVIDSDEKENAALERAIILAKSNQARITVVEVIDKIPSKLKSLDRTLSPEVLQLKILAQHQNRLKDLVALKNENIEFETKVFIGTAFLEIIREVLRNEHDLVIKTAESGGLLDRVFGSDDMHLLRKCPCPVWLGKSKLPHKYQKILAAVDVNDFYSPEELKTRNILNLQILEMASSLAISEFAELYIVSAWETIGENVMRGTFTEIQEKEIIAYIEDEKQQHKKNLDVLMNKIIRILGRSALDYLKPKIHLLKGYPSKEVPAFAEKIEADLVIMGTVARTGIAGFFMGNTAETILNQLDCSVLAVKPVGFETPVTLVN